MNMQVLQRAAVAALHVAALLGLSEASAVTAGAPEHLITSGGECVRIFHSSGAVGCRSLTTKDMAALYPITSTSDLEDFVASAGSSKHVLVMPESVLDYSVISSVLGSIGGVFVYPESSANATFASPYPQGVNTPDEALNPFAAKKTKWNPSGNGFVDEELPFSVVLLEDEALGESFMKRAKKNQESGVGATYTAYMKYYFGPTTMNSIDCLNFVNIYGDRSPMCDPIGGQSAWGIRGDREASETVIAMTSMDANALSHVLAPGANAAASGMVALMAAADALKAFPDSTFDKKIVFAAFQAEKFGFVGSRRFLRDIKQFTENTSAACLSPVTGSESPYASSFCTQPMHTNLEFANLPLANITYAIALDQVGILPSSGNFSVHLNPNSASTKASQTLLDAIVSSPSADSKFSAGTTESLPPSPLLSFVNGDEYGQSDLVGAVIAGYDTEFSGSSVFGSRHDVVDELDPDAIVQAAQVLAETIYQLATANSTATELAKISVNETLVTAMLDCIVNDWTCSMMTDYSTPYVKTMIDYLGMSDSAWPTYQVPVTLYSGPISTDRQMLVLKDSSYYVEYNSTWSDSTESVRLFPNAYEVFARSFLASAMVPTTTAKSATSCTKRSDCSATTDVECVYPGICVTPTAFFHEALSPGVQRTESLLVYDIINESMPLWSEPVWDSDIGSYSFPDPGAWIGWVVLAIGVVVSGVGYVIARMMLRGVQKMKLL